METKTPVYPYPAAHAREHGELEQYRASRKENVECKRAIEQAIRDHYQDNRLDGQAAVKQVVDAFGYDRMLHVLANTVQHKDWDGRISADNKAWARTRPVYEDMDGFGGDRNTEFVVDQAHPGLTDLFVSSARQEFLLTQPLSVQEIRSEALSLLSRFQNTAAPNSPGGDHFMAEVSPVFMARAANRDLEAMQKMMPFSSFALSLLKERKGVFALIHKDENRSQRLRDLKPSVLRKLKETAPAHATAVPKKTLETER